jgi:glyoxalase family protein
VQHPVGHLHHVTATVSRAGPDLAFCRRLLGLRLVKRTVNFDNHHVYHFYYGTERGDPGTIWTTFPYAGWNVPPGVHGAGQIVATAFSVPAGALEGWRARAAASGLEAADAPERFGSPVLVLRDPSGLRIELVADPRDRRPPWPGGGVEADAAIRGLHGVTLLLRDRAPTIALMTSLLGFAVVDEAADRTRLAVGGDGPGHLVDLVASETAAPARNGLGTVHHVALAIAGADEQLWLRGELVRLGYDVTPVRDRCYFQIDLFPGARRGAVRGGHHRAGLHRGRAAGLARHRAEAPALGGAPSCRHRGGAPGPRGRPLAWTAASSFPSRRGSWVRIRRSRPLAWPGSAATSRCASWWPSPWAWRSACGGPPPAAP